MRLMCSRYERSASAESGSGFVITRPILRPLALSDLSEVVAGRFRPFNPLVSCRPSVVSRASQKTRV